MPGEHKAALNPTLDCATSLRPMLGCGAGLHPAQGSGTVLHPAQGSGTGCPMLGCDTGLHPTLGSGTVSRSTARPSRCSGLRGSKRCRLSAGFALCAGQVYRSALHDDVSQRPRFMVSSVFIAPCMRHGISNASISLRPQPYGLAFSKQYKRTCVRFTVLRTIAHASLILPGAAW